MASVVVELDHDEIADFLMRTPGLANACARAAQDIASRAGEGHKVIRNRMSGFNGGRIGAGVYTATERAKLAEATYKNLSKAVR